MDMTCTNRTRNDEYLEGEFAETKLSRQNKEKNNAEMISLFKIRSTNCQLFLSTPKSHQMT